MTDISKIKLNGVNYNIKDANAARLEDLPQGEVDITLTDHSISDGETTLDIGPISTAVADLTITVNNKQDKLIAGDNINIAADGKTINSIPIVYSQEEPETTNCIWAVQVEDIPEGSMTMADGKILKDKNENYFVLRQEELNKNANDEYISQFTGAEIDEGIEKANNGLTFDDIYPIGSVYQTINSTFNPGNRFGGTWSLIADSIVTELTENVFGNGKTICYTNNSSFFGSASNNGICWHRSQFVNTNIGTTYSGDPSPDLNGQAIGVTPKTLITDGQYSKTGLIVERTQETIYTWKRIS